MEAIRGGVSRRKSVVCVGALVFVIFMVGCEFRKPTNAELKNSDRFKKEEAVGVANLIQYIKDKRTDPPTCFAYYWGSRGFYDGGPALATVACATIPPNLLLDARQENVHERHNF